MGVLQDAVRAHERWTTQLDEAIRSGGADFQVDTVRMDDQCQLGRWLYGSGKEELDDPVAWELIRDIHARFHIEAADVLLLARSGHRGDAAEAMDLETPFGEWSATLLAALRDFLD